MKITFDPKADAMYIYFKESISAKTEVFDNGLTMVDFDENGIPIGIEFLDVSKRFPQNLFSDLVKSKKLGNGSVEISE